MLLFTLLTTLFFGNPAAPTKDIVQAARSRPSVGLFYMMGPRAYGSNGFIGVEGSISVTPAYRVSLGLGGDFHKQLDRNPDLVLSQPPQWGGDTRVHHTLRITRSYLLRLFLERSILVTKSLHLLGGVSMGYAQIYSTYEYDGVPTLVPNDTSSVNGMWLYSHQRSISRDIRFWIGPQVSMRYGIRDDIDISVGFNFGYLNHLVSESFSNQTFVLSPEYGLSNRKLTDPFNFSGIPSRLFQKGEGFALDGSLPKNYKTTNLSGFSSFFVTLHYLL